MQNRLKDIHTLIKLGELKKAEVNISKLLREEPSDEEQAQILILRARSRIATNRQTEAIESILEAQTLDRTRESDSSVKELFANCYLTRYDAAAVGFAQKSDVREAKRIYQEIIDSGTEYENIGWIYYQLGRISLIEGQPYVAESYFHKALFSSSNVSTLTAFCYERLGFIAYYESRQPKQALMYLRKAVDTYPSIEPRLWLVQIHLLQSRVLKDLNIEAAIEVATEAFTLAENLNKPLAAEALFTLAELLAQHHGRDKEIVDCLQRFMQLGKTPIGVDVTWSRASEMLGDAYFTLGEYSQAVTAYKTALEYNPDHPWEETIRYRLGKAYYQQQDYLNVLENLKNIVDDTDDYRVFNLAGNALYGLRYFGKAAEAYEKAIQLAPQGIDTETIQMYYQLSQQMNSPL